MKTFEERLREYILDIQTNRINKHFTTLLERVKKSDELCHVQIKYE